MKAFLKKELSKPTIFFVLGIVLLCVSILFLLGIYIIGKFSLLIISRSFLLLAFIFILILLIRLDRFFVKKYGIDKVNIGEFLILIKIFIIWLIIQIC